MTRYFCDWCGQEIRRGLPFVTRTVFRGQVKDWLCPLCKYTAEEAIEKVRQKIVDSALADGADSPAVASFIRKRAGLTG